MVIGKCTLNLTYCVICGILGMDGVDKEKVQRIVYDMSKGSKYFENEERKEAFMRQKIDNMRAQCAKLTPTAISQYQKVCSM